jgi:membrane protease subunit (stomatin/prohibitin family)
MRAAMVGGAGYAVGKHAQRKAEHEAGQDAQIAGTQQQAPAPAQAAPAAAAPAAMSESERIDALTKLKDLLDSGVLTQDEFQAEKAKLLPGS